MLLSLDLVQSPDLIHVFGRREAAKLGAQDMCVPVLLSPKPRSVTRPNLGFTVEAAKLGAQDMWPEPADTEGVAEDASTAAEADDLATELKQLSNVRALPTLSDLKRW